MLPGAAARRLGLAMYRLTESLVTRCLGGSSPHSRRALRNPSNSDQRPAKKSSPPKPHSAVSRLPVLHFSNRLIRGPNRFRSPSTRVPT